MCSNTLFIGAIAVEPMNPVHLSPLLINTKLTGGMFAIHINTNHQSFLQSTLSEYDKFQSPQESLGILTQWSTTQWSPAQKRLSKLFTLGPGLQEQN